MSIQRYRVNFHMEEFYPSENGEFVRFEDAKSELSALREELAEIKESLAYRGSLLNRTQMRAEAAEQRNAAILGKQTKCKECGSDALFWFSSNTNTSGIVEGRLRTNEVTCTFVLGCDDCSATIKTVRADTIAARMTASLKPTESGASE